MSDHVDIDLSVDMGPVLEPVFFEVMGDMARILAEADYDGAAARMRHLAKNIAAGIPDRAGTVHELNPELVVDALEVARIALRIIQSAAGDEADEIDEEDTEAIARAIAEAVVRHMHGDLDDEDEYDRTLKTLSATIGRIEDEFVTSRPSNSVEDVILKLRVLGNFLGETDDNSSFFAQKCLADLVSLKKTKRL